MGARQWRRDNKKDEQRGSGYGVGKAGVTSRNHPEPSATIIDGMSLVQKMKGNDQTFAQLAESALTHILHEGVVSYRIDVVFDAYREDSIKNADKSNRGSTTGIQFRNMAPGHRIQQWRMFLSSSANKANPIRFLVAEWKTPNLREKLNDKQLNVTRGTVQRLQACRQTKKRMIQESCCMQLMPQKKVTELS